MIPPYLKSKAVFYFIAPSFGCTTSPYQERLTKTCEELPKKGHTILLGPNCFSAQGKCASNDAEKRAKEFMNAYQSQADVIVSVGGGEMETEILDYIDFKTIRKLPPKWFVGFSDNTHLTFTLTTLADVTTIYGPCAGNYHFKTFSYDVKDAYDMLYGKLDFEGYPFYESVPDRTDPLADYKLDTKKVIVPFQYSAPFSGCLIGGNLDCLVQLVGTPFDQMKAYQRKHPEGLIFYFEACDLSVVGIKRALLQLKRAGWFTNVNGFLSGRPLCMDQEFLGITDQNAVTDVLKDLNVPILLNVDLGHLSPSMPMKNGVEAMVCLEQGNIKIHYKA